MNAIPKKRKTQTRVSQPSIKKTFKQSKTIDFTKNFRDQFLCRGARGYRVEALDHLADLMLAWAKSSPTRLVFNEFLNLQDTHASSLPSWKERSKKLNEACRKTLQILGANREKLALLKKIDYSTMRHMQGRYDPAWKQEEIKRVKLRAQLKDNNSKSPTFVVYPSYEDMERDLNERGRKTDLKSIQTQTVSDADNKGIGSRGKT